jgi:surface antigen
VTPLALNPWALVSRASQRLTKHKVLRRRAIKAGLIGLNVALLAAVTAIVALNPTHANSTASTTATANAAAAVQPVDQLASVNIAATVARMTNIIEAPAVLNQYNSAQIQLAIASTNEEVVNKPQAVSSAFVSRFDIHTYYAKQGDTVSAIANHFGVSTDSVLWSNGLTGNFLIAGERLYIPPVNGIVYTVKSGDTPRSLAATYHANEAKIVAYNDAELGGLKPGEQIIIPDGQVVATDYSSSFVSGFAWGSAAIYGHNGYDWGNCTWYVATQISVPANWGNAATWAIGARAAGWHVSSTPSVGAIAQNSWMAYGLGHVGIVDAISKDGQTLLIREMNGAGGVDSNGNQVYGRWGAVDVAWQPISNYSNFITR